MLVQLGDFTVAQAGPDEEHPYLPEQAIALMAEFQRAPQLTALAVAAADATNASLTELPASYKPPPRPPRRAGSGSRTGWRRWLRGRMAWAGWASVGAALVVVGAILGAALSSSSAPSPVPAGVGPPPPPRTVCGASGHAGRGPYLCMMSQSQGTADSGGGVQGRRVPPRAAPTLTLSGIHHADKPS